MQPVKLVEFGTGCGFARGDAGHARDRGGGTGGVDGGRVAWLAARCFLGRVAGRAAFEIDQPGFRLATCGEYGLQGLLTFVDLLMRIGQRLVDCSDLGFEIDLTSDAGLGEVVPAGRDRKPDLLVEACEIVGDFSSAALDAVFLGA